MPHSFESHLSPGDVAELDQWGAVNRHWLSASISGVRELLAGGHDPAVASSIMAIRIETMNPQQIAVALAWALVTLAEHPEVARG